MEKINPNDPAMPRVAFDKDGALTTAQEEVKVDFIKIFVWESEKP